MRRTGWFEEEVRIRTLLVGAVRDVEMTDVLVRAEARDGLGVEQEPDRPEHLGHGRYSLARAPGTTSPSTSAPCPASLQALKDWPPSASTSAAGLRVYGGWLAGVGLGRGRRGYSTGVPFQCCCFFLFLLFFYSNLFSILSSFLLSIFSFYLLSFHSFFPRISFLSFFFSLFYFPVPLLSAKESTLIRRNSYR